MKAGARCSTSRLAGCAALGMKKKLSGRPFDLLATACLVQTVEVSTELADTARLRGDQAKG